ncbi:amino acid adenylation domain-containing protein [Rhizobium sp. L1K21]|uniref:amino acid adenylation domain-containing protein n=1 Tax=Rhizobium sp. L1K21 TaxID=2954933 RepID=UPI002092BF8E|nr:amino acid adenylation domain-containing protein [Rhizobium sp. L1K21]MCO6184799.1 amino acid adenylation domain-containing protein [Rhizobium sp. L1K21]
MTFNIASGFARSSELYPQNIAVAVAGQNYTYGRLAAEVRLLAGRLAKQRRSGRIGILASRSHTACLGILAAAWSGATYIPLNLKMPEDRLAALLTRLDLDALIVDERGAALMGETAMAAAPQLIVSADTAKIPAPTAKTILRLGDLDGERMEQPAEVGPDHVAYIIFTSGTTGVPKGVMVPASAVKAFTTVSQDLFAITPEDRIAETTETAFDVSVQNMFLAWNAGAGLYVLTGLQMVSPARFIRDHAITIWASVPSIVNLMRRSNTLSAGSLPSLRLSFFGGEGLPPGVVRAWAQAAPNSRIDNQYGPSEATVTTLHQRLNDAAVVTPTREIMAIGKPYPGVKVAIMDENLNTLPDGTPGEIALAGAQLATGYFEQDDLTEQRFRIVNGERWYLTGDLGVKDENGIFHHLGRIDNQVKVMGNRVELEEVETYLREASGSDAVAAVAWPVANGAAEGIVAFVADPACSVEELQQRLKASLAQYMLPRQIHILNDLPLNTNGKVDRKALATMLDEGRLQPQPESVAV